MGDLLFCPPPGKLETRICYALANTSHLEPNCFGTAFFLKGILPYDMVIFTNDSNKLVQEALEFMEPHNEPLDNSIIISYGKNNEIFHGSYLKTAKPFFGFQRNGSQRRVSTINSIADIEEYLNNVSYEGPFKHKFFTENGKSLEPWARKIVDGYSFYWYG